MRGSRRARFADWRRDRPFWGGIVLTVAGLLIAAVPLNLAFQLSMVTTSLVFAGAVFAVPVSVAGVLSIVRPQSATYYGIVGMLFAIASLVGALGGFGLGTLLGMLGGSLCIAWIPEDATDDPSTETDSVLAEIRSRCRGVVDSLS